MSLTINLTPHAEAWIESRARRLGLSPDEVVRQLIEREAAPEPLSYSSSAAVPGDHNYLSSSTEEFNRALNEIAEMNRHAPVLPEEAFDRENLYEERF